ncbi:MAG: PTS ascorbate transporter subunit IIC [Lachnospiraceae bacterium]|nr:PTS ascorbate transporter subunit IIC [Lachnospiraceae bacterium]
MRGILNFIQDILSTPAIFVGLIAMVGLLLQKSNVQTTIKGTIKTILGFVVLTAGANVITGSLEPFGNLFQLAFHVNGVVPNNEAITSLGLSEYAVQTASIFALGMCANIVMARFSKWKYIFLTGHHALYMSCLISIILSIAGLDGWMLIVGGALLLGVLMAFFPAIMQPSMNKLTGDDTLSLGHFGSCCYWLSAQVGKLFGNAAKKNNKEVRSTEEINFPKGLSFLRDNTVSIAIVMFLCYIIVAGKAQFTDAAAAAEIFGGTNWVISSIIQSVTFSAGIYIVLAGVRLIIAEIVPAFRGISEKIVPNATPAIDCPIVFPFAPNAVLIGFLCSFAGGIVGLLVLILLGNTGLAAALILPGAVVHFFCGATAGVFGNAEGGIKGCVVGAFIHGVVVTFLAAALLPVLGSLGFANTTFSDADFTIVGIIFGNLAKVVGGTGLFVIIAVIYALPILYNYTLGRKKEA